MAKERRDGVGQRTERSDAIMDLRAASRNLNFFNKPEPDPEARAELGLSVKSTSPCALCFCAASFRTSIPAHDLGPSPAPEPELSEKNKSITVLLKKRERNIFCPNPCSPTSAQRGSVYHKVYVTVAGWAKSASDFQLSVVFGLLTARGHALLSAFRHNQQGRNTNYPPATRATADNDRSRVRGDVKSTSHLWGYIRSRYPDCSRLSSKV
ncbi:hypothetical protein EI94DRAFT_794723 [Lactarius quietus]|nr:hypothetical protein EI94DRAFT_794723 [Lactarius quietus]